MEKQFVTYKIALALKEIGFDEECLAKYDSLGELLTSGCYYNSHPIHLAISQNDIYEGQILSPLWQQVIDWFREKNIVIEIRNNFNGKYFYTISTENFLHVSDGTYKYEIARENAINLAIEYIKDLK